MKLLKIHNEDNVAVAIETVIKGEKFTLDNVEIEALDSIPAGHKIALRDISENENVIKYGFPIGHATENIGKGKHVHTHNVKTNLGKLLSYTYEPDFEE